MRELIDQVHLGLCSREVVMGYSFTYLKWISASGMTVAEGFIHSTTVVEMFDGVKYHGPAAKQLTNLGTEVPINWRVL